jgi:hypothetical protein
LKTILRYGAPPADSVDQAVDTIDPLRRRIALEL